MTTLEIPRSSAASINTEATRGPYKTSVRPPSCRANSNARSISIYSFLYEFAELCPESKLLATFTTVHVAPLRSANRQPARTKYSEEPCPSIAIINSFCSEIDFKPLEV